MIVLGVIAVVLLFGIVVGLFALRWIYKLPVRKKTAIPQDVNLPFSVESIPVTGGYQLAAWYFPVSSESAPAVVLVHGWAQTAESLYPLVAPLHQAGLNVLIFDARDHGMSDGEGRPSLLHFSEDVRSAIDWVCRQPKVYAKKLFVVGHSIGGAAALLTTSSDSRVTAVVSISSFSHSLNYLSAVLRRWYIPYRPLGWIILEIVQARQGFRFNQAAPINTIQRITVPVLLIHASNDSAVPLSDAQAIYAQRRDDHVQLLTLSRGGHRPTRILKLASKPIVKFILTHVK